MPDGMGGVGIGAGGGAVAAAVVYAMDRLFGSGKTVSRLEEKITDLRTGLGDDIKAVVSLSERIISITEKMYDWHNVADPEDPSGKLWYFSVSLRRAMDGLQTKVQRLLDLLDQLVRRFERYNLTLDKLITVVENLSKDVSALGIMVGGLDRRRP